MALTLGWPEIALRLALTLLAGALIGLDRDVHGRPAGLRTTLLVCLAASVAMLLANSLLDTVGKAPTSFVNLDLMRLPLGILTGVGFIGGGEEVDRALAAAGMRVTRRNIAVSTDPQEVRLELAVQWRCRASVLHPPAAIADLSHRPGVLALSWHA
jgi:hypothetical protein